MSNPNESLGQADLIIELPEHLVVGGSVDESLKTVTITSEDIDAIKNKGRLVATTADGVEIRDNSLIHLDENGDLQLGDYGQDDKERIAKSMISLAEEMDNDPLAIRTRLNHDRNALASLAAKRRNETFFSKRNSKEYSERYDELHEKYKHSFDKQLGTLSDDLLEGRAKHELERLSNAEEDFRSGDQSKIAKLYNVDFDVYKDIITEEFTKRDIAEQELTPYDQTIDWVQGHTDRVVDKWAEMSASKKILASASVSAVAVMSSVVLLPIGAAVGGVGATGVAGVGLFSTATSAFRKSMKYRLDSGAKQKKRKAIIGEVSATDADEPMVSNSADVLAVLDQTIEADIKDNNKTLRRIGYAAVGGALFGGTIAKYGGQLFSAVYDKGADAVDYVFGDNVSSLASKIDTPSIGDIEVRTPASSNIPALDDNMPKINGNGTVSDSDVTIPELDGDLLDSVEADEQVNIQAEDINSNGAGEVAVNDGTAVEIDDIEAPEDTAIETPTDTPDVLDDTTDTTPGIPENVPQADTITLEVDKDEGFQKVFKDQYGLSNDESWKAYQTVLPYLGDQEGVYAMGGGNFGLSSTDNLQLNPQASAALRSFLESLEDDDELL